MDLREAVKQVIDDIHADIDGGEFDDPQEEDRAPKAFVEGYVRALRAALKATETPPHAVVRPVGKISLEGV